MTLQSLLKLDRLKEHTPTPAEARRLLAAAEPNLADSRADSVSDEPGLTPSNPTHEGRGHGAGDSSAAHLARLAENEPPRSVEEALTHP